MGEIHDKIDSILFKNTGSTTEILEALTGSNISAKVLFEDTCQIKDIITELRFGNNSVLRATVLQAQGMAVSNNVVIYDPDSLIWNDLKFKHQNYPIGKLLNLFDSHRIIEERTVEPKKTLTKLYDFDNLTQEDYPIKTYKIVANGKVQFYIVELYFIDTIVKLFNK